MHNNNNNINYDNIIKYIFYFLLPLEFIWSPYTEKRKSPTSICSILF